MNSYSIANYANLHHNSSQLDQICPRCSSKNLKSGAGKKPGEESFRCEDCGNFLGYSPVKRLKRLRKPKNLTDSLNFLESRGVVSEAAQIFVLNEVGVIGGGES